MRRETNTPRAQIPIVVFVAGLVALSVVAGTVVLGATGTTVSVAPAEESVDVGGTTTFTVVVDNADGGVGAGEIGIAVDDPSVASITDVTVLGSGATDVTVVGDGSSADVFYAFRDTADTGSVEIIEVTVEGQADGTTGLSLVPAGDNTEILLFDEAGTGYDVTGTNGASLTVGAGAATPTPEPETPTPDPATPTPEPATPTPEPATPTPDPATPTPEPAPAPETTLRLDPSGDTVQQGQTTTYEVVVDSAQGGVGAAEIGIAVEDPSVATITGATVLGSGEEEIDLADDGSRVDIDYAFRDTMDGGSFPILEVTVEGQSSGDTSLSIVAADGNDDVLLFDEQGTGYAVTGTTGATLSVESDGGATPTPEPATPTPDPATPTPEPVTPTPDPATPTPEPATPTPDPATPTPEPATPTPEPATPTPDPATPTPEPAPANFQVSNLQAPGSATQGDAIDVSADVENTGGQTATKAVEFRVDTDGDGSIADESAVLSEDVELAPGTSTTVTFEDVDTSGLPVGTLTHGVVTPDDSATAQITVEAAEPEEPAYFQFDLVEGEVIEQLDPDEGDTYHKQDRFIMALIISEEEMHRGGPGTPMDRTYQSDGCEVAFSWLGFNPDTGTSEVAVSVEDVDGCEGITLSYAGYELPDGATDWNPDRAEEQELRDSATVTLHPGEEEVLTVDVSSEGSPSNGGGATPSGTQLIGQPTGIGI